MHRSKSLHIAVRTTPRRARFVPPWERVSASSAEAFFGGLPQSHQGVADTIARLREAKPAPKEDAPFLPFGAVPRYVDPQSGLPAWGVYMQAVSASSPASTSSIAAAANQVAPEMKYTSEAAQKLLSSDYESKLDFKFQPADLPRRQHEWPLGGSVGVVLDIDGVVFAGGSTIDGSDVAIKHMIDMKIPFVFMTNGGGQSEAARAAKLSERLGCHILPSQVILSHTPMKFLAQQYHYKHVLICGPFPSAVEAARAYGFKHAVSSIELQAAYPELVPLKLWPKAWQSVVDENRKKRQLDTEQRYPRFDAVFIFGDHDFDGLNDTQVIIDIITAPHGQIGAHACKYQTTPLHMSADDLLWPTRAPLPRLGQGALREMIASVFESVTGDQLQVVQYGKPRRVNYAYAERCLAEEARRLGWNPEKMRAICMVGDNPETDILGANAALGKWVSVHVLSGVGSAPSAVRSVAQFDEEADWLHEHVSKVPDYVAPTLDHFIRELEHFGEQVVTMNRDVKLRDSSTRPPNPSQLHDVYRFPAS